MSEPEKKEAIKVETKQYNCEHESMQCLWHDMF